MRIAARALPLLLSAFLAAGTAAAQQPERYDPKPGQPGKDVVWVPTPDVLIEKMLDMAQVTKEDFVMDLGSGDGRAIIAAAKRGAPSLGIEFNDKMVEFARQRAAEAGVADKAKFEQGDMYEADISKASVLALFLLEENLDKLAAKFLAMKPGSRIVLNTFTVGGWIPDRTENAEKCDIWCTAHLYIVPAKVEGTWQLDEGTLTLRQYFQMVRGTRILRGTRLEIADGRLRGDRISFSIGGARYEGRVEGDRIVGDAGGSGGKSWSANRVRSMN